MLGSTAGWEGEEYVFTEKMDGEGTTFYRDGLHARSLEFEQHDSRTHIKAIHAACAHDIPEGFRVCGENLTAVHSLRYEALRSYFLVFGVWEGPTCLSWDDTVDWAMLLGLKVVPVLRRAPYSDALCRELCSALDPARQEGLVARPARAFHLGEFHRAVGKSGPRQARPDGRALDAERGRVQRPEGGVMPCLLCQYRPDEPEKGKHPPAVGDPAGGYVCKECAARARTVDSYGLTVEELKKAAFAYRVAWWAIWGWGK